MDSDGVGLGLVSATRFSLGWMPASIPFSVPSSASSASVTPSAPAAGVITSRYCVNALGPATLNDLVYAGNAHACPLRLSTSVHVVPSFDPSSVHADGAVPVV